MKSPLLVLLLLIVAVLPLRADSASALYQQAQRAHLAGNVDEAKQKYLEVLKLSPRHVQARNYLRIIAAKEQANPGDATRKQLEKLQLKEVNFNAASLGSVLDYLRTQAKEDSGGTVQLNFITHLDAKTMEDTKISLNLSTIPYSAVIDYIADLANVHFSYQKYAIVVSSGTTMETTSQQETPTPSTSLK